MILAVGAMMLVGCSGSDEPSPDVTTEVESSAAPTTGREPTGEASTEESAEETSRPAPLPPVTPANPLPEGDALADDPALRTSILLTGCEATETGWQGIGTAENTGDTEQTYRVVVFFTDTYSRAVDSSTVDVTAPAGETIDWTAAKEFTAPEGTQCVLRAASVVEA